MKQQQSSKGEDTPSLDVDPPSRLQVHQWENVMTQDSTPDSTATPFLVVQFFLRSIRHLFNMTSRTTEMCKETPLRAAGDLRKATHLMGNINRTPHLKT